MSLLSKYFYKKYMVRTLTSRQSKEGLRKLEDLTRVLNKGGSRLSMFSPDDLERPSFFMDSGEIE